MTSLEITADLMALVTERLDRLIRESVDVSSFTLADPRLVSDLKVHLCVYQNNVHLNLARGILKNQLNPS